MPSRKPAPVPLALRMMLAALTVLLASCATSSPPLSPEPVKAPAIPELPAEARQPQTPPECLPTCSQGWSRQVEQWRQRLTDAAPQGSPANGSTTR